MKILDALNRLERAADKRSASNQKLIAAVNEVAQLIADRLVPIWGPYQLYGEPVLANKYELRIECDGRNSLWIETQDTQEYGDGSFDWVWAWVDLTNGPECSIDACHKFASDLHDGMIKKIATQIQTWAKQNDAARAVVENAAGKIDEEFLLGDKKEGGI